MPPAPPTPPVPADPGLSTGANLDAVFQAVRSHPEAVVPVAAVLAALAPSGWTAGALADAVDALVFEGNLATWAKHEDGPAVILSARAARHYELTLDEVGGRWAWVARKRAARPSLRADAGDRPHPDDETDPANLADGRTPEPWEVAAEAEESARSADDRDAMQAAPAYTAWAARQPDGVPLEAYRAWMVEWRSIHQGDPKRRTDANRLRRPAKVVGTTATWPVRVWSYIYVRPLGPDGMPGVPEGVPWTPAAGPCPVCGGRPPADTACVVPGCDAWGSDVVTRSLRPLEVRYGAEGVPGVVANPTIGRLAGKATGRPVARVTGEAPTTPATVGVAEQAKETGCERDRGFGVEEMRRQERREADRQRAERERREAEKERRWKAEEAKREAEAANTAKKAG